MIVVDTNVVVAVLVRGANTPDALAARATKPVFHSQILAHRKAP
jgi:hypothetical protein